MSNLPEFPDSQPSYWERFTGPIPWQKFTAEILELYTPPLRAKGTLKKMRFVLELVTALGVKSTEELTVPLIAKFVQSRHNKEHPNSTYSNLAALRAACNYAASQGYCRISPFAIRKDWIRRVESGAKKHHSREDIARVLTLMQSDVARKRGWSQWRAHRLYVLTSIIAYTGLRKKEALYLRTEDVDFTERMILIRPRVGNRLKTESSAQPVPIPDALLPILQDWIPHLILPEGMESNCVGAPLPEANPTGAETRVGSSRTHFKRAHGWEGCPVTSRSIG